MNRCYILFILLIMVVPSGIAQYFIWTEPVPVTDSVRDNINCSIQMSDPMNTGDSVYIVWEVSEEAGSTDIYARNLSSMAAPFPLLSQPGVHYRNPKKISFWEFQVQFYLFYETDINGNWDIYYVEYMTDGTLSDPVPVCVSPSDETNLQYSYEQISWQSGDSIMVQDFSIWSGFPPGSQPHLLDAGGCQNPAFSGYFCAWEKEENNHSYLWFSALEYVSGNWIWTAPVRIDSSGDNSHLFMTDFLSQNLLVWQHDQAGLMRNRAMDLELVDTLQFPGFPGFNNGDPTFINLMLPVDNPIYFPASYTSWVSDSTGNDEVYVNETLWDPNYFNISSNPAADRNPRLFSIFTWDIRVFLTWESFRNDHWQLWISWMDIPIGIDNRGRAESPQSVTSCPNPFADETLVQFWLDHSGPYLMEIYSTTGRLVKTSLGKTLQPGPQQIPWDGCNDQGEKLPAGLYLVTIQASDITCQGKLILR